MFEGKINVAAVVVTYNRKKLLIGCLNCLQEQTYPCDVILIDNCSTDGTEQDVASLGMKQLSYERTNENIGGAGGFNLGLKRAVDAGYTHIWLMDDDTYPEKDALEKLIGAHYALDGEYGFLASSVLWTDGSPCAMNIPKFASGRKDNPYRRVVQASFVSFFLSAETVRKVGLPIKEFFVWGDDTEYSRRIAVIKKKPSYFVENSVVIHVMKQNTGSNIAMDHPERIDRYLCSYRNEYYVFRQEKLKGMLYYYAKCLLNLARIVFLAESEKKKRCHTLLNGMKSGRRFKPPVEYI